MDSIIKPGVREELRASRKAEGAQQIRSAQEKLKKWADKVVVGQYGGAPEEEHKEGDVWEDSDGKKWTIKNGIKQTIRKNQGAITPFWCPRCGGSLSHWLQMKFYKLRGACHDCWVKYETKMRIAEVYFAFERREMRKNERDWLKDAITERLEYIENFKNPQLHFQDGRWEELATKQFFEAAFDKIRADVAFLRDRQAQLEKEEEEDAIEQAKLSEWEQANPW